MAQLYTDQQLITDDTGTAVTANVDGHSPMRLYNIQNGVGYEYTHNASGYWQAEVPAGFYKRQIYGSGGYANDLGLTPAQDGGHEGIWIGPSIRMYIKRHVRITGTVDSPQTLTTGSSPLATPDDEKMAAYPSDWTATSEFILVIQPEQERIVALVEGNSFPSVSGGNILFKVADTGIGNAHEDGNVYATIIIIDLR